jgi:hypothetical protein
MMLINATDFDRKSGGAQWRDLCADAPSLEKRFSTKRSLVEAAVSFPADFVTKVTLL